MKIKFFLISSLFFILSSVYTTATPTNLILAINNWENQRVSNKTANSGQSEIATDQSGTAIVWNDARSGNDEIYFSKVNNVGNKVLKEVQLTETLGNSITPVVVWNGKEYGVFWSEGVTDIYFIRVSRNVNIIGEGKHLVAGSGYSVHISAVWNGSEYGVVWWDVRDNTGCPIGGNPRGRAYFMRVSKDGEKIGEEVPVPTELSSALTGAYRPLIVWTGNEYGIFWTDQRESGTCFGNQHNIYFAKLDSNGNKLLGDIKLERPSSSGNIHVQSVTWDGENFGIAYGHGTLYFAKMSLLGETLTSDVVITDIGFSNYPRISWNGSNYVVVWSTNRDRTPEEFFNNEIYFARIDSNGNKAGVDERLTFQKDPSSFPSNLIFSNEKYKISWLDQRDGIVDEVYFAQSD